MPPVAANTYPVEIVAVDGGLVAFGSETSTVVWTSVDGRSWTDAGRLDFMPVAAAALGDQIVVIAAGFGSAAPTGEYVIHLGTMD